MVKELSIIIPENKEKDKKFITQEILNGLAKAGVRTTEKEIKPVFIKKSIDARRRQVKFVLRYKVYINEEPPSDQNVLPKWKKASPGKMVIIIGSGPAGLFAALKLLEKGITPIIIEQGACASERKRDIARISTEKRLNPESNYCFGEGGAGTFSDGKLYTRSNKRGDIGSILKIFAHFGADPKITTDAHAHIGTNKLPSIIENIRNFILEMGGSIYFDTKCTDFEIKNGAICGIKTVNTKNNQELAFTADKVILATGHSARDIYLMLAKTCPSALEAKTFAAGVRVEHPRELIDQIQYHGTKSENLGAAEYRLVTQVNERGVYSFCMCPGGFVVPSQTENDSIVVNGMSSAGRNSKWSNAAIVVEIRPEDIPQEFQAKAAEMGCPQIAGLLFREHIEKLAWENAGNQKAPAQMLKDFLADRKSQVLPATSYTPGIVSSNINQWMPAHISERLREGFKNFDRSMNGFICEEALLIAPETRTSTPVRILRDKETLQSPAIKGLYPCGEGSGYSGGIVSSAMDGEKVAAII